jgi:hypothetical protein
MSRPGAWPRVAGAFVVLGLAATSLGMPTRPVLPVGAVDADALTAFVTHGLRLLLTVAIWYLLLTTILTSLAARPRLRPIVGPLARRLSEAGIGVIVGRLVATSTALGVSLPATAGATAPAADEPPVMRPIDPAEVDEPESPTAPSGSIDGADRPTMTRSPSAGTTLTSRDLGSPDGDLGADSGGRRPPTPAAEASRGIPAPSARAPQDGDGGDPPVMGRGPDSDPGRAAPTPGVDDGPGSARHERPTGSARHVVTRGESFWTIAEGLVRSRPGGEGADLAEIARTWQRLIDRNAEMLVDPGNPDLLHVGQVIHLVPTERATPPRDPGPRPDGAR